MDFRLRDALGALEEIEIASFVGLPGVLGEHLVIAAIMSPVRIAARGPPTVDSGATWRMQAP